MKKSIHLGLVLAMTLGVVVCGGKTKYVEANADVEVAQEAEISESNQEKETELLNKVVVYNSSVCTVLEAFGRTDAIVGAYGSLSEMYDVPECGKWNEVDVEAVIAAGAEAVFAYEKYTTAEQIEMLKEADIECYFIELSDADLAAEEVEKLGTLFGCEEKALSFVELYTTYDALLEEKLASVETVLHAYVEGTAKEPFKTANQTTAAHKLIEGAGLANIYADNETAYPERNLEAVISAQPDVIVKLMGANDALDESFFAEYADGLAGVKAADEGKVILLNNEVGTTAVGSIIGRLYVAKFAYPDLFTDVDVDAVYETLCTEFLGKEFTGSGAYFK